MKPIPRKAVTNIAMVNGNERRFKQLIIDGRVKEWVGFGWLDLRRATPSDRRSLRVVGKR